MASPSIAGKLTKAEAHQLAEYVLQTLHIFRGFSEHRLPYTVYHSENGGISHCCPFASL